MHKIKKYKAVPPTQTIQNIRNILFANDIFISEAKWFNYGKGSPVSSVGIVMLDTGFSVAGKGIDEKYALASGYAEFMERLQSLLMINLNFFTGNQKTRKIYYSDYKEFNYDIYRQKYENILKSVFNINDMSQLDFLSNYNNKILLYPFYDVYSNDVAFLPTDLIILSSGSNGLASGNTPEEAIIQGFCEIMERYVLKEIYTNKNLSLPNIPNEILKNYPQWRYIELLNSMGITVNIKDCSLKGQIPVVGVLIMKNDKALFNLGASPDFRIAIERCFTEMFQGIEAFSIESKMQSIIYSSEADNGKLFETDSQKNFFEFYMQLREGKGRVPLTLLDDSKKFQSKYLFCSKDLVNIDTLKKLVYSSKKLCSNIYIRDISFMSFPTYHIYIPGLSDIKCFEGYNSIRRFHLIIEDVPKARDIFYNLETAKPNEIEYLIKTLEALLKDPFLEYNRVLETIHNLRLNDNVTLNQLDPENLLIMLYCKINKIDRAYAVMKEYIERKLSPEQVLYPPDYALNHVCLLKILESLTKKISFKNIKKELITKFPERIIDDSYTSIQHINIKESIDIPTCKDCHKCQYNSICFCEGIVSFTKKIQKKIEQYSFEQNKLSTLLH